MATPFREIHRNIFLGYRGNLPKLRQPVRHVGFIVPFLKGASRLGAILIGRSARNWWRKLPKDKQVHYRSTLYKIRHWFYILGGTLLGSGLLYYVAHLEETPITKRKRFISITDEELKKISVAERDMYMEVFRNSNSIYQADDLRHEVTRGVVEKLLASGITEKMAEIHWKLYIIECNAVNAFVLPTGEIFVFTGLIKSLKNEDELATILGHEIAHAILNHAAEGVSHKAALEIVAFGIIAVIWAVLPNDIVSYMIQQLHNKIVDMFLGLPYSRKLEREADEVGMMIAAKACFDPQAAPALWQRLHERQEEEGGDAQENEYLSTHPSHKRRKEYLESLLPNALAISEANQCTKMIPEAQQFRKMFKLL